MILNHEINPDCTHCEDKSCAAQALSGDDLKRLASGTIEQTIKKGGIILPEGSLTTHIIYLKSGIAKEYQQIGNNQEYILQIVKSGAYLGLTSLFGDNVNHISYTALSESTVCYIDRKVFKTLLMNNAKFSFVIIETICRDNLNSFHRFINQQQKHVHGKLADALLYLSRKIFESDEFILPISRLEISFLIGTSRESVSKQLRAYEREGLLEFDGKKIRILKTDQLEKISRFG